MYYAHASKSTADCWTNSVSVHKKVMVIDNVSTFLNGTRVECSYGGRVMETTVIIVIGSGAQLSLNFYTCLLWYRLIIITFNVRKD